MNDWPMNELPDPPNPADLEDDAERRLAAEEAAEALADRNEEL